MEWIRVEDRLPTKDETLVLTFDGCEIQIAEYWFHDPALGLPFFYKVNSTEEISVTHWMPLPERPPFTKQVITNDEWVTLMAKQGRLKHES